MRQSLAWIPVLVLLASSHGLAEDSGSAPKEDPIPSLDDPHAKGRYSVEIIGWSKDERRYALRVYRRADINDLDGEFPYCKGYIDTRGEKFSGSLSLLLYEEGKRLGGWLIRDEVPCTPPKIANQRLGKAKAALAKQGIRLVATGATVLPSAEGGRKPSYQKHEKALHITSEVLAILPHGPWARQPVRISYEEIMEKDDVDYGGEYTSGKSTVDFRLYVGDTDETRNLQLLEFHAGPISWGYSAGGWSCTFDRIFLSPSGKRLVALARFRVEELRSVHAPIVMMGTVDMEEYFGRLQRLEQLFAPPP
jgi:hypothetical protein